MAEKLRAASVAVVIAVGLQPSSGSTQSVTTYTNARFGYSVIYPANIIVPEREADNGDGRAFHARKHPGKLLVWGAYRDQSSEGNSTAIARSYEADCDQDRVTYQVAKPQLIAFSCISRSGGIIYQKTLVEKDLLRSVRFEYPYRARAFWDPLVAQIAGSLHRTPE